MTADCKKPFIAGNWKMHMTIPESVSLVIALDQSSDHFSGAQMVVIPPFTALSEVGTALKNSPIKMGAQNLFWEDKGAYTGEIAAAMIKDAGCEFAVIGHSERRQYFGETDTTVNKKIKTALAHDITPIMCLGETKEEREAEKTIDKINSQLSEGLDGLSEADIERIIIAYEPIWAIGTGLTATPKQAQEVHDFIREHLTEKHGKERGAYAIILYGGSVKPANAYSLLKEKDINGALVGGASLQADSFVEIAKESIKAYKDK